MKKDSYKEVADEIYNAFEQKEYDVDLYEFENDKYIGSEECEVMIDNVFIIAEVIYRLVVVDESFSHAFGIKREYSIQFDGIDDIYVNAYDEEGNEIEFDINELKKYI